VAPHRVVARAAGEPLGGGVPEHDAAVVVEGEDADGK
jgi:hypothetical protein